MTVRARGQTKGARRKGAVTFARRMSRFCVASSAFEAAGVEEGLFGGGGGAAEAAVAVGEAAEAADDVAVQPGPFGALAGFAFERLGQVDAAVLVGDRFWNG